MTKNLADELGSHGINVTCVHPGGTRTERTPADAAVRSFGNVIGRLVDADEVAYLVAFLASPAAGYVNGINLPVDGGRTKSL